MLTRIKVNMQNTQDIGLQRGMNNNCSWREEWYNRFKFSQLTKIIYKMIIILADTFMLVLVIYGVDSDRYRLIKYNMVHVPYGYIDYITDYMLY